MPPDGHQRRDFYVRHKKCGGVRPSELRRLRQPKEENRKLKQIMADLSLDKAMQQHVVAREPWGLRSAALIDRRIAAARGAAADGEAEPE